MVNDFIEMFARIMAYYGVWNIAIYSDTFLVSDTQLYFALAGIVLKVMNI